MTGALLIIGASIFGLLGVMHGFLLLDANAMIAFGDVCPP
jgi:hypothetical protein